MPPNNGTITAVHHQKDSTLMDQLVGSIDLPSQPPLVQVSMGAAGGVLAGYLFGKTSKIVAAFVGGTVLFVQFCDCQGYIQINKKRLSKDLSQAREQLMAVIGDSPATTGNNTQISDPLGNIYLKFKPGNGGLNKIFTERIVGGFLGGLLLGFGLS